MKYHGRDNDVEFIQCYQPSQQSSRHVFDPWWMHRGITPKYPYFRLVKYYQLPRSMWAPAMNFSLRSSSGSQGKVSRCMRLFEAKAIWKKTKQNPGEVYHHVPFLYDHLLGYHHAHRDPYRSSSITDIMARRRLEVATLAAREVRKTCGKAMGKA